MAGLLITGTSSDAGKSLIVTGLCRAFSRRGLAVAPFKSQNMSNNSMVCADGSEIGRAQYLQAEAAGVTPSSVHNPVLLKPSSDRRAFVIVRGRPAGTLEAGQYATGRKALAEAAYAAYDELEASCDLVVCEGAGSPAEINLRAGDYVNMGLAQHGEMPVVLVADIDRGGALAAIFGTWGLVADEDRPLFAGYLINRFRGDAGVLTPGLDEVTRRTGMPNFGVLPWLSGMWIDSEDALSNGRYGHVDASDVGLRVAVVELPRTSNATDTDALAWEPGVDVQVTADPAVLERADLVVVPGSRATVDDLAWLRRTGLAEVLVRRHATERPIVGICGGYQMFCERIEDPIESRAGQVEGLGVLPGTVRFTEDKVLGRPDGAWHGHPVRGYTIHHGRPETDGSFPGGASRGATYGTMWHGLFDADDFRAAFLTDVAERTGAPWRPSAARDPFRSGREAMIDRIADALEEHIDLNALLALTQEIR